MTRAAWIAIVGVILAVAWGFSRLGPGDEPASPRAAEPSRGPSRRPQAPSSTAASGLAQPGAGTADDGTTVWRDLFVYADDGAPRAAGPTPAAEASAAPAPLPTPTPAPPVRWVGFVRQGPDLRAALSDDGEVVVVGIGERVGGRVVVALDVDRGVCLRAPDGREEWLPPGR